MSANTPDDRISTQKDLSKLERWAAISKLFNKDNSKAYTQTEKINHTIGSKLGLANYCF